MSVQFPIPVVDDLFEPPVLAVVSRLNEEPTHLPPEEQCFVARASRNRRMEFATGRQCARWLLRRLGVDAPALQADSDRCPIWPAGTVGSIAHADDLCIVAAAPSALVAGVGVDVEPDEELERDLWPIVCTGQEREWLDTQPVSLQGRLVRLLFCAKEAVYKCWFPRARRFLSFQEVGIRLDLPQGRFRAELSHAAMIPNGVGQWVGRWLISGRWVFAGIVDSEVSAAAAA